MTIATRMAALFGRAGAWWRITRLKPSTMTARNMASSTGVMMAPILVVMVVMLFMNRTQRKKDAEIRAKLKKGDKVVSQSGLIGELVDLGAQPGLAGLRLLADPLEPRLDVGNLLAHQVLAGDAEMGLAGGELADDLGRRDIGDLDSRQAGDRAAIVAGAAPLGELEAGAGEERRGSLLQSPLGGDGEDERRFRAVAGIGPHQRSPVLVGDATVIASDRASKDARPSGRAMAKQSRDRRAPCGLWIAASLRSSR